MSQAAKPLDMSIIENEAIWMYHCKFLLIVQGKNKNRHTLCYTYVAGLFRRVIIQSGSPLAQWSYSDKVTSPDIHFKIFVSSTGCLRNSSRLIKECLQNIPTEVMHRQIAFKYVVGRKDKNIYILRRYWKKYSCGNWCWAYFRSDENFYKVCLHTVINKR